MSFLQGLFGPPNVEKMKANRNVEGLIKALSYKKDSTEYDDSYVRQAAAKSLGELGDARAVEPLIAALHDNVESVRGRAAEVLGKIGDGRAVEPLIAALRDNYVREAAVASVQSFYTAYQGLRDNYERPAAIEALVKIGKPAVEPLITALREDNYVREAAAEALGKIRDARAVEPLIAALHNNNKDVCKAAAEALVKIGPLAVESLIAALHDNNKNVRTMASEALDGVSWQPVSDESKAWYLMAKQKWNQCAGLGAPAVEPLIAALHDNNNDVCKAAAGALGVIGDARAVEPLIALLKDNDRFVRRGAAAGALGVIGDARAVEPLIALLKDNDVYVRRMVIEALEKIGDARAVEPLIALIAVLKEIDDAYVRGLAMEALGKIYHNHRLDAVSKQRILALQEKFPRKHTDEHGWDSQCQQATHSDHSSGLEL